MVTAETAAVLPVLVLVSALAVTVVGVADAKIGVGDAAHLAALAAARGDTVTAQRVAAQAAPGGSLRLGPPSAGVVTVTVERSVRLGPWTGITLTGAAVAPVEPGAAPAETDP